MNCGRKLIIYNIYKLIDNTNVIIQIVKNNDRVVNE